MRETMRLPQSSKRLENVHVSRKLFSSVVALFGYWGKNLAGGVEIFSCADTTQADSSLG
jgi:hypothetical protein